MSPWLIHSYLRACVRMYLRTSRPGLLLSFLKPRKRIRTACMQRLSVFDHIALGRVFPCREVYVTNSPRNKFLP